MAYKNMRGPHGPPMGPAGGPWPMGPQGPSLGLRGGPWVPKGPPRASGGPMGPQGPSKGVPWVPRGPPRVLQGGPMGPQGPTLGPKPFPAPQQTSLNLGLPNPGA